MRALIAAILVSLMAGSAFADAWNSPQDQADLAAALDSQGNWQGSFKKKIRQSEALQKFAIKEMVGGRCAGWLAKPFRQLRERNRVIADCRLALKSFMAILNPKVFTFTHPVSKITASWTVAFPEELQTLILDSRMSDFLTAWSQSLERAALGEQPADLFEIAKSYAGSDDEAIRWIAILFQDTSKAKTHIQYLKTTHPEPSDLLRRNVTTLSSAIDRMMELTHDDPTVESVVRMFPSQVETRNRSEFSQALYHYYVPAYVAARSVREGQPAVASFFVNFVFNYIYEAMEDGTILTAVWEPSSLSRSAVRDTYMGYVGAFHGAQLKTAEWETPRFVKAFMDHPFSALESLSRDVTSTISF
jgi:hypothetical protein